MHRDHPADGPAPVPKPVRSWALVFLACFAVVFARTTPLSRSVLYAEDGRVFLERWLTDPSPWRS